MEKLKIYRAILFRPTSETGHTGNRFVKESQGSLKFAESELIPKEFKRSDGNDLDGKEHICIEEVEVTEKILGKYYYVKQ